MSSLYPLGPTHPDTNIISIYTHPAWCDAYSAVCCAKVEVSRSRAMRRNGGRYGPAGTPGASSCIQTPQLVNTRLMLQSRQGLSARSEYTVSSGDLVWSSKGVRDRNEGFQCQCVKTVRCLAPYESYIFVFEAIFCHFVANVFLG